MKKVWMGLVGVACLLEGTAEAAGRWRNMNDIDPKSANRYACAKFLKHALSHPQPEGITEDSRPIYSEEALREIKVLSQKQHKWFERRAVHQRLKDDPTPSGELYRTALPQLYFSRIGDPLPGAINAVSAIAGYMLEHDLSFDVPSLTQVFEDWENSRAPSLECWDAQCLAQLSSLWRVWNWEPYRPTSQ